MTVEKFPDRTILIKGKRYLYFGGTSYLGMATHPHFQDLLYKSLKQWGTAYGSSRNSNIKLGIYQKAEALFADIVEAEAALTVSSGTLAGNLVIAHLAKSHDHFFHYPKTHPAILKSTSKPLFVDGKLDPQLTDGIEESIVIAADAILSLAVTPTNFNFLNDISASKRITLLVDESHSLGIVGEQGRGVFKTITHPNITQKIMISSLTKAYGCSGGIIAGSHKLIEAIKNDAVFISASGMNPIFLQTFYEAQNLFDQQLKKLRGNLRFLYTDVHLSEAFHFDPNYPVIYWHSDGVFEYLKSKNMIITNFKYPNYDTMMNRIVITANHTEADLEQLKSALRLF
jgi:8-amino-7-oxononanoate synthase